MTRHSWSQPTRTSELRTVRVCRRCGLIRVTHHDGGPGVIPWVEFEADSGMRVEAAGGSGRTPACEPVEAGVRV
jgi:hypothetical protein